MPRRGIQRTQHSPTSGFSLLEVVIAMFVLSLISLALLPLLMTTTQATAKSRTQVSALAQANAELALFRQKYPDKEDNPCAAVRLTATTRTGHRDAATGNYTKVTASGCPTGYPGVVTVTVEVHSTAALDDRLARLTSQVLVATA